MRAIGQAQGGKTAFPTHGERLPRRRQHVELPPNHARVAHAQVPAGEVTPVSFASFTPASGVLALFSRYFSSLPLIPFPNSAVTCALSFRTLEVNRISTLDEPSTANERPHTRLSLLVRLLLVFLLGNLSQWFRLVDVFLRNSPLLDSGKIESILLLVCY